MRTTIFALVLAFGLAQSQDQPEPPRHDKYASDPAAYCLAGKPMENDHSAHECHCAFMCSNQVDGDDNAQRIRIEDQTCEMWCTKSRCKCHPEETCDVKPTLDPTHHH